MSDVTLEILKWVGIALAAGFVGYFGRYLAMRIIDRLIEKKKPSDGEASPTTASTDPKLEKKQAKQAAKEAKKSAKQRQP